MTRAKCTKCKKNFAKPGAEECRTCSRVTPARAFASPGRGNNYPKCSYVYSATRKCMKYSVADSVDMFGKPFCLKHLPDQVEAARRRKDKEIAKVVHDPRMRKLMAGEISVEELDDEELLRGQFRSLETGRFATKPPAVIPKPIYDKMVGEIFKRADKKLQRSLLDVVETMVQIMKNPDTEDKDKLKAGMWIFERVRGKNPENIVLHGDKPFQQILERIVAGPRADGTDGANALTNYLDAEVVEDGEDD